MDNKDINVSSSRCNSTRSSSRLQEDKINSPAKLESSRTGKDSFKSQDSSNITFVDVAEQFRYVSLRNIIKSQSQSKAKRHGISKGFYKSRSDNKIAPPFIRTFGPKLFGMRTPWSLNTNEINERNNIFHVTGFFRLFERLAHEYTYESDSKRQDDYYKSHYTLLNSKYGLDDFFNTVYSKVDYMLDISRDKSKYDLNRLINGVNSVNAPIVVGGNVYYLKNFHLSLDKCFHQKFAVWDLDFNSSKLNDELGSLFNNQILSFKMHRLGFPCLNYIITFTNSLLYWLELDKENHFAIINYTNINCSCILVIACSILALNPFLSLYDVELLLHNSIEWRSRCRFGDSKTFKTEVYNKCASSGLFDQCTGTPKDDDDDEEESSGRGCFDPCSNPASDNRGDVESPRPRIGRNLTDFEKLSSISSWPSGHRRYLDYFNKIVNNVNGKVDIKIKPFRLEKVFFTDFFQLQAFQSFMPGTRSFTKSLLDSVLKTSDDFFSIEIYELDFYHKAAKNFEEDPLIEPNLYHSQQVDCSFGKYKSVLFPDSICGAPFENKESTSFTPGVRLKCCSHDYTILGIEDYDGFNTDECIPVAIDFTHDRDGNKRNLIIAGDVIICLIGHYRRSTKQVLATYSFNTAFLKNDNKCIIEINSFDFDFWNSYNWRLHGHGLMDCMFDFGFKSKHNKNSFINPNGHVTMILEPNDFSVFAQPFEQLKSSESSCGSSRRSQMRFLTKILSNSVVSTLSSSGSTSRTEQYVPSSISYRVSSTPHKLPDSMVPPFPSIADFLVSHIVQINEQSISLLANSTGVDSDKCMAALKIFQGDYVSADKFVKAYFDKLDRHIPSREPGILPRGNLGSHLPPLSEEGSLDKRGVSPEEREGPKYESGLTYHSQGQSRRGVGVPPTGDTEGRGYTRKNEAEGVRSPIRWTEGSSNKSEKFEPLNALSPKSNDMREAFRAYLKDTPGGRGSPSRLGRLNMELSEKDLMEIMRVEDLNRIRRELSKKIKSRPRSPTQRDVILLSDTKPEKGGSVATRTSSISTGESKLLVDKVLSPSVPDSKQPVLSPKVRTSSSVVSASSTSSAKSGSKVPTPEAVTIDNVAKTPKPISKKGVGKKMMPPPKKLLTAPIKEGLKKAVSPIGIKLHWKPISGKKLEESIFSNLPAEDNRGIIDTTVVKRLFSRVKQDSIKKEPPELKAQYLTVFDQRRAQNLAILLRFDYSLSVLVNMVENLRVLGIPKLYSPRSNDNSGREPCALDLDLIYKLKQSILTKDEAEQLRKIEADPERIKKLRDIEKRIIPLARVNLMTQKLRICEFTATFLNRIDSGMDQLNTHLVACNDVLLNHQLPIFMTAVLEWGNFVNHGSFEFVTKGFALSSVARLADFKSFDQSLSSLHYLLVNLCVKFPNLSLETMSDKLKSVYQARRTPTSSVTDIISELSTEFTYSKDFLKQIQSGKLDVNDFTEEFVNRLVLVLEESEKLIDIFKKHKNYVHEQIRRVWNYLGEECKSQDPLESIFETLWHLLTIVEKSFQDIAKKPDKYLIALQCPVEQSKLRNIFVKNKKHTK